MNKKQIENDVLVIANDIKTNAKKTNWFLLALGAASLSLGIFAVTPANAIEGNGGAADYVGHLKDKLGGADDAANIVYKGAAGTMAFAAGAKLLKRVVYA
jgi:hypothetical protein